FFFVLFLYGIGFFTRTMGVLSFLLMLGIYNRNSIYLEGTDSVYKCFWFLLIFAKTGHAWSVDNWLRCYWLRRKGLLEGSESSSADVQLRPVYRLVPAWPRYLFIFQLSILYLRTGVLKFGRIWNAGVTLYYALNNTHFFRFDGLTQHMSALFASNMFRISTWTTLWFERLFFLVLFGLGARFAAQYRNEPWLQAEFSGLRGNIQRAIWVCLWAVLWRINTLGLTPNEDAHTYGVPPALHLAYGLGVPACYLLWRDAGDVSSPLILFKKGLKLPKGRVLGPITVDQKLLRSIFLSRRLILGLGIFFHGFLFVFINLGLFPLIMLAIYPAMFTGDELRRVFIRLGQKIAGPGRWERFFLPAAEQRCTLPLLRQKTNTQSTSSPKIAYGYVLTTVVGLCMSYHCLAVALRLFQAPPPLLHTRDAIIRLLETDEWLAHTRTWQDWGMFPSPPRSSGDLETTIVDEQGKEHILPNYLPFEKKPVEISYDRQRKLRRLLAREDCKQYRRTWAMYQCREFELKTGTRPRRVILNDISSKIPSVAWVTKHGAFDALKLPLERESAGSYACSGDGRLPAYIKERHGIPLTKADERIRDSQEARLRRTFPKRDASSKTETKTSVTTPRAAKKAVAAPKATPTTPAAAPRPPAPVAPDAPKK